MRAILLALLLLLVAPAADAQLIRSVSPSTCPNGTSFADGCPGAPVGTIQLPALLAPYAAHRPPWNVAGVDYAVGIPTSVTLSDPTLGGLPSGCSFSGHTVTCSGNNITVQGWDFSLHGGTILSFSGNTTGSVVQNNKFKLDPNCNDPLVKWTTPAAGTFTITQNTFDGGGATCGALTFATFFFGQNGNGATVTITYNYFTNVPQDVADVFGSTTGSMLFVYKYNVTNVQGFQGHPDGLQYNTGNFNNSEVAFNTYYIPANGNGVAGGTQPYHVEAFNTSAGNSSAITNTTVHNNTIVTPGTCTGPGFPTGCTINFAIACKADAPVSGGGPNTNVGFQAYGNYVDPTGALNWFTNSGCTGVSNGTPELNINLNNGATLP